MENFPFENAGFQFRAYKWKELLEQEGYEIHVATVVESKKEFDCFLQDGNKSMYFIRFMWKRLFQCMRARNYETLVVRRELLIYNDYGNLFMEKMLHQLHANVILDFDDDIAHAKKEPRVVRNSFGKLANEAPQKFLDSLKIYQRFTVGSSYLKNYVLERSPSRKASDILVVPTCVNYEDHAPKVYDNNKELITFGWIGGNHNLFLLEAVIPALNEIAKQHKMELMVVAGKEYLPKEAQFPIRNVAWSLTSEIDSLREMDIGIMPLLNTPRDKGKAGYKLIQYMGMGVVSMASAVTVNTEIIEDKESGFLVEGDAWLIKIQEVISRKKEWSKIGTAARSKVLNNYSFISNKESVKAFLKPEK